ncbi:hypothetical protein BHE74_00039016 [Ensete ventricosum]|nr:hypothetical protein GW17_00016798 [Ensete ventricosum]RWW54409.1 hypothetical protein BHE74_00039016 [Ensete ventricosum]RZS15171.1 hypothetical protein BHM03_00046969 [Ensete ventricosum]
MSGFIGSTGPCDRSPHLSSAINTMGGGSTHSTAGYCLRRPPGSQQRHHLTVRSNADEVPPHGMNASATPTRLRLLPKCEVAAVADAVMALLHTHPYIIIDVHWYVLTYTMRMPCN